MRRLFAVLAGLLGVLVVPLSLSAGTSWLAIGAHLALTWLTVGLAIAEGMAGRPGPARAWAVWHALATAGLVGALQVASWVPGGWSWLPVFALVASWSWMPLATALLAGRVGEVRRRRLAARAVARRRAA
ncbi:MAG: hypothetical protein H6733_07720 [Alphaproteobacteria bacterium]|nr:hypothetical protein [Alphaproteobacteria bacterium]